jgi:hypothetical protein
LEENFEGRHIGREKFSFPLKRAELPLLQGRRTRSESQLSKENDQKQKQIAWPDIMTQWQADGAIPSPPKLGERTKKNLHRVTAENSEESIYSSDQLFGEVNSGDQGLTRLVLRLWEEDSNNNKSQNLGMEGALKVISEFIMDDSVLVVKS